MSEWINKHNKIAPTITTKMKESQTNSCRFTCLLTCRTVKHDEWLTWVSPGYVTSDLLVSYQWWLLPVCLRTLLVADVWVYVCKRAEHTLNSAGSEVGKLRLAGHAWPTRSRADSLQQTCAGLCAVTWISYFVDVVKSNNWLFWWIFNVKRLPTNWICLLIIAD